MAKKLQSKEHAISKQPFRMDTRLHQNFFSGQNMLLILFLLYVIVNAGIVTYLWYQDANTGWLYYYRRLTHESA